MRSRLAVAAVVLALAGGYAAADVADVVPGFVTAAGPPAPAAAPRPTASDPPRRRPAPVLGTPAPSAPAPVPARLAATLRPLLTAPVLGPRVSATVVDAATGAVLLDAAAGRTAVPASTLKLLTSAAVLSTVGGPSRLATRVVQGGAPDEVVLVGAGDMLLAPGRGSTAVEGRAGLADLARQVATQLRATGTDRVVVRYDDTLFTGPDVPSSWAASDVRQGFTGRVSALGLATDRARPGHASSADPARTATSAFVAALVREGVPVSGTPARAAAPEGARVLGVVDSAPVGEVLGVALRESDNALAEVMARLVAHAVGRPTTDVDAAQAVLEQVQRLGVDTAGTRMRDASGLAPGSLVPPRVLADVLVLAAGPGSARLRPMLEGLPVAGFSGTLSRRFAIAATRPAAGTVRAKTGTLTGTSSLAGAVVDADGRLLVVVVLADRVPVGGTPAARTALDRVAAAVAGCGCR